MESNEQKSLLREEVMAPVMEQPFQMDLFGESVVLSFLGKKHIWRRLRFAWGGYL